MSVNQGEKTVLEARYEGEWQGSIEEWLLGADTWDQVPILSLASGVIMHSLIFSSAWQVQNHTTFLGFVVRIKSDNSCNCLLTVPAS